MAIVLPTYGELPAGTLTVFVDQAENMDSSKNSMCEVTLLDMSGCKKKKKTTEAIKVSFLYFFLTL